MPNSRKYIYEIGVLLALVGIPIASVVNEYLRGTFKVTYLILIISLLLVADWTKLFSFKIRINWGTIVILILQFYIMFIGILDSHNLLGQPSGMIYTIFMIVIWIVVASRGYIEDDNHFINTIWWGLGIFNVLLFVLLTDYLSVFSIKGQTVLEFGADRLTLSKMVFTFLIVHLVYLKSGNKKNPIVMLVFLAVSAFNLLYCGRRASMVYFGIIVVLHFLYYERGLEKLRSINFRELNYVKIVIRIIVLLAVILIMSKIVPNLFDSISYYLKSIVSAIGTFLGISGQDVSASVRNELRDKAFQTFQNASFFQIVFGRGYMYQYLDFPVFQAIVDMGLVGLVYIYIQCIYPFKFWLRRNTNVAERFFQYLSFMYFFDNFFAGIPYGYGKYIPLLFLFLQVRPSGHVVNGVLPISRVKTKKRD